ncbi:hypothetical protein WJX75_009252 [Coccomyxa subellipsoidea]|uniref:HTH HARE-type domain-containing protein n=1 Tax=Coccomyxa subellipsoidea TaxID=248742 RepID=A0ABR2YNZ7_9CHLO
MQRKRSSDELGEPPAMLAGHTSKRGRVVKPKLWDDGTEAPIAMGGSKLARRTPPPKDDSGPSSGSDRPRRPASASASLGTAKKATVPLRDETGRFAGVRPKTAAERSQSGISTQGGIFKSAAEKVLRQKCKLMSTGDIAREAIKYNLISCQGKTPEATMASALYTDLKRKESASIFIRPHEGLFGLREWLDKDFKMEEPEEQLNLPRGNGSAKYRYEASVGVGEYAGDYESDEHLPGSADGGLRVGPYLPPRTKRRIPSAPANGTMKGGAQLPGWPRGGLSRAASTGAVDEATTARTEFGAVRSKSMGKDALAPMDGMDALMEAVALENQRSRPLPDEDFDDDEMEPSTAGSPLGKEAQRDDARSRRGLRAAPVKSRKLQPPSPEHNGRREVPLPMRRKRSSMMTHAPNGGSHRSALLDDDALGRSPRSVAAKARYANPSAQAIASQAEEEGLEVEGFGAARLKAAQAKLAAAGGLTLSKDIKQDNILNLPLPDFEIEAGEDGEAEEAEDALTPDEAPAKDAVINEPAEALDALDASRENSEDGSVAPAAAPQPEPVPSLALLHKMEMALRSLENSKGHMHPSVGNACIDLSKAYLAAKQGEQAGKHLHRAIGILNQSGRGNNLSKEAQEHVSYLLGRVADLKAEAAHTSSAPAQQLPQQLGEPAPTSIPTPKMLNPPPYILPSGVPAQPTADQVATPSAQPATQSAAPVQAPGAAQQAARPSAPAGLGMGLPQPPAPAPPSQTQAPAAPSSPGTSKPVVDGALPATSAPALIHTSA